MKRNSWRSLGGLMNKYEKELRKTNMALAAEVEDLRRLLQDAEEQNFQRFLEYQKLSKYCKELERLICEF